MIQIRTNLDMKPFGRTKIVRFKSKKDCHPKREHINWLEGMNATIPRSTMKQLDKKTLDNVLVSTNTKTYMSKIEDLISIADDISRELNRVKYTIEPDEYEYWFDENLCTAYDLLCEVKDLIGG